MPRKHLYQPRSVSIEVEPLLGNAIAGALTRIAVDNLCRGFLVALLVFKILNVLTVIERQQ